VEKNIRENQELLIKQEELIKFIKKLSPTLLNEITKYQVLTLFSNNDKLKH